MPQMLYLQGNIPRCPLDRRLSGPQTQSGCGGEEKNSQPLLGLKPPVIHRATPSPRILWNFSKSVLYMKPFLILTLPF